MSIKVYYWIYLWFALFKGLNSYSQSLIISEVLFNPCCGGNGNGNVQTVREWIEIQNVSYADTVDISGWYIRTDLNNNIYSPIWGDAEIQSWENCNPSTFPNVSGSNSGTFKTNTTKIYPGQYALIIDPTWNSSAIDTIAFPDSCIILTVKNYLNMGSNDFNVPNNGLLNNPEDLIYLYNGNPINSTSLLIDSLSWIGNIQKPGFSLQLDDDCTYRWHNSVAFKSSGGYEADTNNSILADITPGSSNFNKKSSSISGPDTVCLGDSASFSVSIFYPCLPNLLHWNFGEPLSGLNNTAQQLTQAKHAFISQGTHTVSLAMQVGELKDTAYKDVYVIAPPPVNIGNDTAICNGNSFILNAGIEHVSYIWSTGDTNSIIIVDSSGNYMVTAIDKDGCSISDSIQIEVMPLPLVSFQFNNICQNDTVYFKNQSANGSYFWDWGDQTYSNLKETYHIYDSVGSYTINLTTTDLYGCIDSLSQDIIVYPIPNILIDVPITEGCQPLYVDFANATTDAVFYFWHFGDGDTSLLVNPSHLFTQSGIYNVSLTAISSNGCSSFQEYLQLINVFPAPTALFTTYPDKADILSPGITFTDMSSNVVTWQWDFGDNTKDSSQNPVHLYADTGTYEISLVILNDYGCTDTAYQQIIVDPIYTFYVPSSFTPNQDGKNDFFVPRGMKINAETFYMGIFNRWGKLIYESNDLQNGWNGTINGSDAPTSVYNWLIQFVEDGSEEIHKYRGRLTLIR